MNKIVDVYNTEELFKNNKDLDGTMSERMFGTRVPYPVAEERMLLM